MNKQNKLLHFANIPTVRLTLVHLAIIMTLSITFSVVLYKTSTRPMSPPPRQGWESNLPTQNNRPERYLDDNARLVVEEYLQQRKHELLIRLIWINLGVLFVGIIISYVLARWSLRPIEEAMDSQIQFVSDASHELRTPLTVLQTTNEVASRKKKLPISEARELIAHNVDEVKKLKNLTEMLLGLLKDDKKPVEFTDVNLQDIVSDAMSSVVEIAQAKNISIEDTVPKLKIKTDYSSLVQIISILLDNAVKYSDKGQQITISADKTDNKIYLHVADGGIGIRASDLPHIFNRFYRADKSRSKASGVQGYGLGLAIAQKLAKQIDTRITVKSETDKGSTFTAEILR